MAKGAIQPTKASLNVCTINDISYLPNNFHVKELRIYEDICKFYFTGQLVIETMQNSFEYMLGPTVPVVIEFEAPRTDGKPAAPVYRQKFRIHSYESHPLSGGTDARMEHKIQLISQEFYNDRHNTVMQGFSNIPSTAAARQIHNQYVGTDGMLRIDVESSDLIAKENVPHQARNVKPVKAIHDILDKLIYAQWKTCAPIYYKDRYGYVISPLQYRLENAPVLANYMYQKLGAGNDLNEVLAGYEGVIHFKALTPPGEANSESGAIFGAKNSSQYFDLKSGSTKNVPAGIDKILNLPFMNKIPNLKARVQQMLSEADRSKFGARNMMHIIDDLAKSLSTQKHGPGGYNIAQEAFLTALTYTQKYWISAPLQSGLFVTCGTRINFTHPIVEDGRPKQVYKKLFVPRLIHEIKFTEGTKREPLVVNGITDMYCVNW